MAVDGVPLANAAVTSAPFTTDFISSTSFNKKSREISRRHRRRKQKKKNGNKRGVDTDDKVNSDPRPDVLVEIDYIPEKAEITGEDFTSVIEKFSFRIAVVEEESNKDEAAATDKENGDSESKKEEPISNKKKKIGKRMNIAELKQKSLKPGLVEVWDTTAPDPMFLVFLKSYRNTVPVPRHWCQKRNFLQGKRGIEKRPFQLPDFIAATGIEKLREAYTEKEDSKKLKHKQRDRVHPKMRMVDMDYQILHDAFFKYQTKPKLTILGDLYHEGKEFENKFREMRPGSLSHELKEALGMLDGDPNPWLIMMQRYGPPPSYPELKIPGLNAPIPPGATFGGAWGNPPVDELGSPLYGDVFGVQQPEKSYYEEEPVDKSKHWGDLEEEEEEEQDIEEEGMEEEELVEGTESVDSPSSVQVDQVTPDAIDLRKQPKKNNTHLYEILEEREAKIADDTLLGTTHTFVYPRQVVSVAKKVDLLQCQKSSKFDVTIPPEELEAMEDGLLRTKLYSEAQEEEKLRNQKEDFRDMVAYENKRKRKMQEKDKRSKKRHYKF